MRWIVLPMIICILAGGCDRDEPKAAATVSTAPQSASAPKSDLPVIAVDSKHAMRQEGMADTPYVVKAARGVLIDAGTFQFNDPHKLPRQPNVVRLLYDGSEYSMPWHQHTGHAEPYELVQSVMRIVSGSAFTGFAAGKEAVIGIGYETQDQQTNHPSFEEFWVAKVIFTP
jgi:hypothetical protein